MPETFYTEDNQRTDAQELPTPAVIRTGDVDFSGDEGAAYNDQPDGTVWADYMVVNQYDEDRHVYMGGVTSPEPFQGDSVSFVQLSAPTLVWVCKWTGCKQGEKPAAPDPTPPPGWVLLGRTPEMPQVAVAGDGATPVYRLSGMYYYGHRNPDPARLNSLMAWPRPPWLLDAVDRAVTDDLFEAGLKDVTGSQGSEADAAHIPAIARQED